MGSQKARPVDLARKNRSDGITSLLRRPTAPANKFYLPHKPRNRPFTFLTVYLKLSIVLAGYESGYVEV